MSEPAGERHTSGSIVTKSLRILELCSGTESFSNVARERGHMAFTVDIEPKLNPSMVFDVSKLTLADLPEEWRHPDIVWASPPCTKFSVAALSHNWEMVGQLHYPKNPDAVRSCELVKHILGLIKELEPRYWFIENPRAMLRKMPFMVGIGKRRTVTYCQYGDTAQKPTDIWTNCYIWKPKPPCSPGAPCHAGAPRGSSTKGSTQWKHGAKARGMIPGPLCAEIISVLEAV